MKLHVASPLRARRNVARSQKIAGLNLCDVCLASVLTLPTFGLALGDVWPVPLPTVRFSLRLSFRRVDAEGLHSTPLRSVPFRPSASTLLQDNLREANCLQGHAKRLQGQTKRLQGQNSGRQMTQSFNPRDFWPDLASFRLALSGFASWP